MSDTELNDAARRMDSCLEAHGARWMRSYLSKDRVISPARELVHRDLRQPSLSSEGNHKRCRAQPGDECESEQRPAEVPRVRIERDGKGDQEEGHERRRDDGE